MFEETTAPNPAAEVGASLTEHLAAQDPKEWPTNLLRNDVPGYTDPSTYMGQRFRWVSMSDRPVMEVKQVRGVGALAEVRLEGATDGNWLPLADFRRMVNEGELEPVLAVESEQAYHPGETATTLAEEIFPELCDVPGDVAAFVEKPFAPIPETEEPKAKRARKVKEPEVAEAPVMTLDDLARCIELKRAEISEAEEAIAKMQAKALEMVGPLLARMGIERVSA